MFTEMSMSPSAAPKVLVIDDSLDAVKLIATILKHYKCDTSIAFDGQDALPLFESHDFDLVILDWTMPRMSAPEMLWEVDRLLQAKQKFKNQKPMPLLVYSGHDEAEIDLPELKSFEYLGILNKRSYFKNTLRSFDVILARFRNK